MSHKLISKLAAVIISNDAAKKRDFLVLRKQLDKLVAHARAGGKLWFQTRNSNNHLVSTVVLCPANWSPELASPKEGELFAFNRIKNLDSSWETLETNFTKGSDGLIIYRALIMKITYQDNLDGYLRKLITKYA